MNERIDVDGVDLTPYIRSIKAEPDWTTVRYTPYRYTGWRRWWRRLTLRSVESPTFEFEAIFTPNQPFLPSGDEEDVTGFSYNVQPVSPVRKVDE